LDRKNVFDGIRLDASNFLENKGNGNCGVISVLKGKALIDGSKKDKAPNRKWTADEIKNSRTGAAGKVGAVKMEERKGKNGDTFKFLPEDAAKWDAYTQRINDLESKGSAITDKETKSLKLAKSRRDDLEINFTTVAAGKRIAAMRANNLYEKSLLPDDFRWFAKECGKMILLVQDNPKKPLMHLCFRDGTRFSAGTALFRNLFTKEGVRLHGTALCRQR